MGSPIRTPRQATQMQRQNVPSSIFRRPNNFPPRACHPHSKPLLLLLPNSLSHSECDRALLPTLEHASLVHSSVHEAAFHRPGEMPTTDGPGIPPAHPLPEVAVAAMASHEGVQVILHLIPRVSFF